MKKKVIFLLCFGLGIFIIVQVVMPLVSYKLWELTTYSQNISLLSPSPDSSNVLGVSIQDSDNFPALVSNSYRQTPLPYKEFEISIPSINLEKIRVLVESNDFENSLAQLPGTALPGEKGNIFITGHSSLSQFYSPTNFKAIFAHLPEIKRGDSVIAWADGQKFEYEVIGLKIVDPKEVWVINPPDNIGRYMSLMTCVPPGLNLKRLIVLSRLKV